MENLNQTLFLLVNAAPGTTGGMVEVARFLAEDLIWIVPAGLVIGWLRGSPATRRALVAASLAAMAGLAVNLLIGLMWYHPRPFEAGIGQTLLAHARDSSLPSDHLTLIWSVAFSLLMHRRFRLAGWALATIGLPVAWARIYLGVHFPLDMVASLLVGLASAEAVRRCAPRSVPAVIRVLMPAHRRLLAPLIARGWVSR